MSLLKRRVIGHVSQQRLLFCCIQWTTSCYRRSQKTSVNCCNCKTHARSTKLHFARGVVFVEKTPDVRSITTSVYNQCSSWVGKRGGCKRNRARSSARSNIVRAQFSARTTKKSGTVQSVNEARTPRVRAPSSTRTKADLGTILQPIDENMGTNLSENTKT